LISTSLIIVVTIIAWITGYYPIAFVNWQPVFAKSLDTNYAVALSFYKSQLKNNQVFNSSSTQSEIKRAVLISLIEDKIIDREVIKKIGENDFKKKITEKLNEIDLSSDKTKEGAKLIYGLSIEQLKEIVLTEQVKREIAEGLFSSPDKNFNNWLGEKFKSSKIIVLIPVRVD
ncbi:MAG: hypothetical protein WC596_04575, partial [Candidatus Shapirobacteria bacterium]